MSYLVTNYQNDESCLLACDGLIVNSKEYSCAPEFTFSLEEVFEVVSKIKKASKIAILNINRIINENELNDFSFYWDKIKNLFDYYFYSDYALLTICDNLDKLIYDSKTLVCSKEECESIPTKSFISCELSYEEVRTIIMNTKNTSIDVFGYHQIMYSRRPLLGFYQEFTNDIILDNKVYDLKENTRDEHYKIIQNSNGTYIYTSFIYGFLENIDLFANAFLIRVENIFLDKETLDLVLLEFIKAIKGEVKDLLHLKKKNSNISSGFLEQKLFLLKESGDNDD